MRKIGNIVLETPRLKIVTFQKESINKLVGFWRGAVIEKYGPGDTKTGNSEFLKVSC